MFFNFAVKVLVTAIGSYVLSYSACVMLDHLEELRDNRIHAALIAQ